MTAVGIDELRRNRFVDRSRRGRVGRDAVGRDAVGGTVGGLWAAQALWLDAVGRRGVRGVGRVADDRPDRCRVDRLTAARVEHGTQFDHAGDVDGAQCLLLIAHAREVDHDRVTLDPHVRLSDALSFELGPDLVTDDREFLRRRRFGWREDHRHTTLQVEAENRGVVGGDVVSQRDQHDQHDADQRGPEATCHGVGQSSSSALADTVSSESTLSSGASSFVSSSGDALPEIAARAMRICTSSSISSQKRLSPSSPVMTP